MALPKKTSKHIDMERDGLAIQAEYLQTDPWAIDAILRAEIMTYNVMDPCCGDGRMAEAARARGHKVFALDIHDWGYSRARYGDFLHSERILTECTVFMNPPFSKACAFVDKALALRARKIVCFQRSVWRESQERREWWEINPPNRIYQCGERANCWYGTIPLDKRPSGGMNQPHSWYVWEKGNPAGTLLGTIWKDR